MKMTFRWFGEKDDCIPLWQIRQIPGVTGVVGGLYDEPLGVVWPIEKIAHLERTVESAGLGLAVGREAGRITCRWPSWQP